MPVELNRPMEGNVLPLPQLQKWLAPDEPVSAEPSQRVRKHKINFPNLDGMRFFCFFLVFGYHIRKMIQEMPLSASVDAPSWYGIFQKLFRHGQLGVNFFFVLSGFLITYLLIKEKEFQGKISIGKFYMRRILKIWPLFYMTILIGFVLVPLFPVLKDEVLETARLGYYLVFLNNFDVIENGSPRSLVLGVLWSVAVEEQFYFCWPLLVAFVRARYLRYVCAAFILGSLVFRAMHAGDKEVLYFHTFSVIGDMALGGLLATLTAERSRFFQFVTNLRRWQIAGIYLSAIIIILFKHQIFFKPALVVVERLAIALCFGFIILEQNFSTKSFFKISKLRFLSKFGTYTYGLYCLHFFAIYLALELISILNISGTGFGLYVVHPLSALAISVLLSLISFHFFEKKFLLLKSKFSFIVKE